MKRFITAFSLFVILPVALLAAVYFITDPYKTLKPFSLSYFDLTNRDYLSSELFLMNFQDYHYDSYIFGSSRCCGLNSYQWLSYLPESSSQFVFQAWGETLTGIEQKVTYIDKSGGDIKNALVMIDIPGTFSVGQFPSEALSIKDYHFSGQSVLSFQAVLLWNFLQKPSQWFNAVRQWFRHADSEICFDPISNDWNGNNRYADISVPPEKDSLKCSPISRRAFLKDIQYKTDADIPDTIGYITSHFQEQLINIRSIFEKHHTDYKIVISPAYCYTNPKMSVGDSTILADIFGSENVFDYSGKNELTSDYNNFKDPNHFGSYVGWHVINDIYGGRCINFKVN